MKPPKCPRCGKEHWSMQRCGAEKTIPSLPKVIEAAMAPTKSGGRAAREGRSDKARAREQLDDPAGATGDVPQPLKASRGGKRVDQPLTNAERQKKYRERLGDEYRVRNRERMRWQRRNTKES